MGSRPFFSFGGGLSAPRGDGGADVRQRHARAHGVVLGGCGTPGLLRRGPLHGAQRGSVHASRRRESALSRHGVRRGAFSPPRQRRARGGAACGGAATATAGLCAAPLTTLRGGGATAARSARGRRCGTLRGCSPRARRLRRGVCPFFVLRVGVMEPRAANHAYRGARYSLAPTLVGWWRHCGNEFGARVCSAALSVGLRPWAPHSGPRIPQLRPRPCGTTPLTTACIEGGTSRGVSNSIMLGRTAMHCTV